MPFKIVRNDIAKVAADIIVNTANPKPAIGDGVDSAIYAAAGRSELLAERVKIGDIKLGEVALTPAFNLPAKYIAHTVGPIWQGGENGEETALYSCYKNSLNLCEQTGCHSIAFPLISAGNFGFPQDRAVLVANKAINDFLSHTEKDITVYLVVFEAKSVTFANKFIAQVQRFIDDEYVEHHSLKQKRTRRIFENFDEEYSALFCSESASIEDAIDITEETFQQMLLRLIAESGKTNVQVYKRANQNKKLFSRIKNDVDYQPKKNTAISFAIALQLDIDTATDLLRKAGYALSPSNKFDLAITYFIQNKIYDMMLIDETLYELGLPLLCNY